MLSSISVCSFDKNIYTGYPFSALTLLASCMPHILYNQDGKEEEAHQYSADDNYSLVLVLYCIFGIQN